MKYTVIGQRDASLMIMGCMRIAKLSDGELDAWIDAAMDTGVNMFDHADIYAGGASEENFGRALKRRPGLRDQIILQSKCGIGKGFYDLSAGHILASVDGSLRRLQTERLDVLLLHRPDALMEPEEIAEAFTRLRAQGKVVSFGVSNMNAGQRMLLQSVSNIPLCVNQIQFGLMHTGPVDEGLHMNTQNDEAVVRTRGILTESRLSGVTLQAWSPLQYGMFSGTFIGNPKFETLNRTLAEMGEKYGLDAGAMALAWILRVPAQIQIVLGTSSAERIKNSCPAADVRISREDWYALYTAAGHTLP